MSQLISFPLSIMLSISTLLFIPLSFAIPPVSSPPPLSLLQKESPIYIMQQGFQGQMDDPELVRELSEEETLVDLQNIEYDREALSVSRGLMLSLIPGGGWSLIYANRKAQGVLMILASAVGYGMGTAYLLGVFDEEADKTCLLTDSSKNSIFVGQEYCNPASSIHPTDRNANMSAYDPYLYKNDDVTVDASLRVVLKGDQPTPPTGYRVPFYNEVSDYYKEQQRGKNYNGASTGQIIIASTYVATTLLSAIWASSEIKDQNNELRKRIESTAQAPSLPQEEPTIVGEVHPTFQYNGQQTLMGVGASF